MLRILRAWTLQRYVLREFAVSFVLALSACTLLMLLGVVYVQISNFEGFGFTTGQVAMLFPYLMPRALAWAVPPAAMIAVTIVFGRLSADNEILAAQAGGAPLRIMAFPLFFCGVVLSLFCLWCNQGLLRWGNQTIRNEVFKIDKPEFFSNLEKPGNSVPLALDGGGVVHINWLPWEHDAKGAVTKPIHIAYFQNQEIGQTVLARDYHADYRKGEAGARILSLTLRDAQIFGEQQQQQSGMGQAKPSLSDMQSFCKEFTLEITLPQPGKLLDLGESRGEKGWWENWDAAAQIKKSDGARRKFMLQRAAELGAHAAAGSPLDPGTTLFAAEAWSETRIASEAAYGAGGARDRAKAEEAECFRKLGLSLLPLSTVVLGIGLGLLVRKSQRLIGFLLGIVVYAMLYYPMMIVSKELARSSRLPLWALFLPNLVLILIGYGLWRAYERGWLENVSDGLSRVLGTGFNFTRSAYAAVLRFSAGAQRAIGLFRNKTDGYVTGSFVGPLLIVLISVAALLTAMDLFQHGEEVIDGVVRAGEPLFGEKRTQFQAILDVFLFYGIRSMEMICDVLPLLILVAGILCVTVLVRNNEHLIFKSSGVPLQRAFRPIIRTTLLFSLAVTALRETAMPHLIMVRDALKPMVYHRSAMPTAVALHTHDSEGKDVIFQASKYSSSAREGTNLRIIELGKEGRVPMIVSDRASWNGNAWRLQSDPAKYAASADGKIPARPVPPGGYRVKTVLANKAGSANEGSDEIRPLRTTKTLMTEWHGAVTPSFLESERLGTGVLSLTELWKASAIKPELKVEWWRRVSEWTLAVFLLWVTIPLMVSELRGPVAGVAWSIAFGGASWFLNMACSEAGRTGYLPPWAPLLPPMLFFVAGAFHYYRKMPT